MALGVAGAPATAQAPDKSLTDAERGRLDRGELVTRPMTQQRGELKLIGGTAWQVVDLPVAAVWRGVQDTARYERMLPAVQKARRVDGSDQAQTIYIEHEDAAEAHYHVNLTFNEAARNVFFKLDRSHVGSLRAAWGFLRIREWDDGQTLITFGVMADVGTGVVSGVVRPVVHEWMLKVPRTFKEYIEGAGHTRYARAGSRSG